MAILVPAASAATINVSTGVGEGVANDGTCSLREGVSAAYNNAASGAAAGECAAGSLTALDTIFVPAGVYTLAGAASENGNVSGDLDVISAPFAGLGGPVRLQGVPTLVMPVTIDADDTDRAIHLLSGTLTVDSIDVIDGKAPGVEPGGGIAAPSTANLTLVGSSVSSSESTAQGGGITFCCGSGGTLTLTDSEITLNSVSGVNGGGGIYAQGALTINGGEILTNHATGAMASSAGGGINFTGTKLSIDGTVISSNDTVGAGGGGIEVAGSGTTQSITDATISGNTSGVLGGGVEYTGSVPLSIGSSTIKDNTAVGRGGISSGLGTTLNLSRSRVFSNDAINAAGGAGSGGLGVQGTANITDSAIDGNSAQATGAPATGGGIYNDGVVNLRRSTVENNFVASAGGQFGGGIGSSGTLKAVNATISDNSAPLGSGGGVFNAGPGNAEFVHSTLAGNTAGTGDAIHQDGILTVAGTILTGPNDADVCEGIITSSGNNIDSGTTCGFSPPTGNDLESTPPMLGGLADNGGPQVGAPGGTVPLQTRNPAPGAAIDHVPAAACDDENGSPLLVDERGVGRPFGSGCEVGAVEHATCAGVEVNAGAIIGTSAGNTITGTPAADVIYAQGGNDVIKGGASNDKICGGSGTDTASYAGAPSGVHANASTGAVSGGAGSDSLSSIERLTGSSFADVLTGNSLVNMLLGGAGNDRLLGLSGNDTALGGSGSDTIRGGSGRDKLYGESGRDKLYGDSGRDRLNGGSSRDRCNGGSGSRDRVKRCEVLRQIP